MTWQRTIGIDLAIQGVHKAAGCNEKGDFTQKNPFHFGNTKEDFESLINNFVPPGTDPKTVAFIMEPTGNVWRLLSAFLIGREYTVFQVKTQKVFDLRRFYSKHTKSDFKDAQSMARMPWVDKDNLRKLVLKDKELFVLERIVKQFSRLGNEISKCKNRVHNIFQILNPNLLKLLGDNKFNKLGMCLFKKFANPFKIKQAGLDKFRTVLSDSANGNSNLNIIDSIYNVSLKHCELLEDIERNMNPQSFDLDAIGEELELELKHIEFLEKQRSILKKKMEKSLKEIVPHPVLQSFKGIGNVIASVILTSLGNLKNFPNIRKVKGFLGLIPKKKQTGNTDRQGLKITKASSNILKEHVYLASETARQYDVQFADKYSRLIKAGKHHKQAVCVLSNMLIVRVCSVLKRYFEALYKGDELLASTIRYELRDTRGHRITASEAREIVLRDYSGKKELERRLKQAKEKIAMAFNTRQSKDSSKGRFVQSSPVVV